jgi:hypothetical protein
LGLGRPPDARPLYIGKAEASLAGRDVTSHFGFTGERRATSVTGASTLRRSLAALLHETRGFFRAIPRNPSNASHYANYGLSREDDDLLSDWMRKNLRLACWPKPESIPVEGLRVIERELARLLLPPLNIAGAWTPWQWQVKAARSVLADEARQWENPVVEKPISRQVAEALRTWVSEVVAEVEFQADVTLPRLSVARIEEKSPVDLLDDEGEAVEFDDSGAQIRFAEDVADLVNRYLDDLRNNYPAARAALLGIHVMSAELYEVINRVLLLLAEPTA